MGENRPRMENHEPSANGRCANGSRFGVGGVVPAAGCGFRRACPWGGQRTLSRIHGRERMDGAQMEVASGWVGLSLRRILGFGGRGCGFRWVECK